MPKVKNLIKQHNSKILSKEQEKIQRSCNCRIKESYPLNGKCLHQCMLCKAEVTTSITLRNNMERQRGSSNIDKIITPNL